VSNQIGRPVGRPLKLDTGEYVAGTMSRITDSVGATASTTQQVTVSPATPTAALSVSPSSGAAPLSVLASLANSSSPDGTISSGTLNFGDGSATVTVLTASHTYYVPGNFTVTGTVTDSLCHKECNRHPRLRNQQHQPWHYHLFAGR
jgi:PKD repeat protein